MILLIDNYDSFSYNLYQMLGCLDPDICVCRNDEISVEEVLKKAPDHVILSPGPGYPAKAGICEALVRTFVEERIRIPVLGVCLGHQAICEALGGKIQKAAKLMHGKQCRIRLDRKDPLFEGLEEKCLVGRYHSLAAREDSLPKDLRTAARAEDGEIMAVRHLELPIHGVQFHPESILTPDGAAMLKNFLKL
ncbi:MAG: anthranilate synthase component II [Blautia sp.]|jgi:anthranilate synthase component 2